MSATYKLKYVCNIMHIINSLYCCEIERNRNDSTVNVAIM